jgi:hypothetical protein
MLAFNGLGCCDTDLARTRDTRLAENKNSGKPVVY